jgi:S-formylglutathione hydrolase FrmB
MNFRPSCLLSFLTAFALLSLSACHQAPPPPPDHPRIADGVKMQDVQFASTALGRTMTYRVYQPAAPPTSQPLSVVYLLHGGGGSYQDWSNNSDVAQYAAKGLVLVMPEGDASYFVNAVKASKDKYGDYLTRDLIADVESRFPVARDRAHRAVVGVSMGGYAAIHYALARPDLFVYVGAISPAIDVPERRFGFRRMGQWWRFRRVFGAVGSPERQALDPFFEARSAHPQSTPYMYLTAGQQEPLLAPTRRLVAQLRSQKFAFEFHTKPGGHDWNQWNAQLPLCFTRLLAKLQPPQN